MGTDTSFSYQLRVAACDRCGAPCEAAVTGGSFACRFCHAQNYVDVRDEALVAPARPPLPEHERIARLRMQDGRPLLPPPSLQALLPGGQLLDWKVDEAVSIWNATRLELRAARANYEAAERLVFLTMVLAQHFQMRGDRLRQREMLEGALDVSSLPRHRQIMRGFLCRAAVRSGDLQAAESWLQPCDPCSDDLQMDSAYRFSRAFIDTARGSFQRVLEVLGHGPHDVPIEDASDDVCAVFRANAWEKLGRPDQAVMLLRQRLAAGGGTGRQTVDRVIQHYADWQLCSMSYPQACAGYAQVASARAARSASGGIHKVFVPLGALMLLGGLVAIAFVVLGIFDIVPLDEHSYEGLGITGGVLAFMGLVFLPIGLALGKKAARAAWLRVHGISAMGQVESAEHSGMEINGVPMMRFTILVQGIPGQAPYRTTTTALGSRFAPGSAVPLRVHPTQPGEVLLELD